MKTGRTESTRVSRSRNVGSARLARLTAARLGVIILSALIAAPPLFAQDTCPSWTRDAFGSKGMDYPVHALATFDDGTGPALYAGGEFTTAGRTPANRIARWDGAAWQPLGNGVDGKVRALAVFDDGRGPALYAGGEFRNAGGQPAAHVARWDGAQWSPLGPGVDRPVHALATWDDGAGPALFVGGSFTLAGAVPASRVARYDGAVWSPLGSGVGDAAASSVDAIAAFDDRNGPALFVGGEFTRAGDGSALNLARWSGGAWSPLHGGVSARVRALATFDDGGGNALYVGGDFVFADGSIRVNRVVRWQGFFSTVGTGFDTSSTRVSALHVHADGAGPRLIAAGRFTRHGSSAWATNVAAWDGATWSGLGERRAEGTEAAALALATADDGTGSRLFAGGEFFFAGGGAAERVASWNGENWLPLGRAGLNGSAFALTAFDDGSGSALYVGGSFTRAGDVSAGRIARWNGREWSALGSGVDGGVTALAVHDDGTGPALYAGGTFVYADSQIVRYVARWDGARWQALDMGLPGRVSALAVYDDGSGPALYAGGDFFGWPGLSQGIARWDGTRWRNVGGGVDGTVHSLTVVEFGSTNWLVVGGSFTRAGAALAPNIVAWDGTNWNPFGGGVDGPVYGLETFDDGTGKRVFATGDFELVGGFPESNITSWDGSRWRALQAGLNAVGRTLAVCDDGSGPALYVGGDFTRAGSAEASRIARWNGTDFLPLGTGMDHSVWAITSFVDEGRPAVCAGGFFVDAGGEPASFIARWSDPCAAILAGTVNTRWGSPVDVLFVNGTSGRPTRRLSIGARTPLSIFVAPPPTTSPGSAAYALYVWHGDIDPDGRRTLPRGVGSTCMPTPLSGGSPRLQAVWNNTGKAILGTPTLPSMPAPWTVLDLPSGAGSQLKFVVQGIIRDPGSAGSRPASVTNAIAVETR